jgi:glycopeptide antibiotics resistance protein
MDTLGQILWYLIPFTPLITFPFVWKRSKDKWYVKFLLALFLALGLSVILYVASMGICLRDGLGPS